MEKDSEKYLKWVETLSSQELVILKNIINSYNEKNQNLPSIRELRVLIENKKRKINKLSAPSKRKINLSKKIENLDAKSVFEYKKNILNNTIARDFRGWILPTGQILSQYINNRKRQDHGELARLFFKGLEIFDKASYDKMMELYNQYRGNKYISRDIQESFVVEVLGWIQVSECGKKRVITCGERWQDKLIDPFIRDYDFDLEISDRAKCEYENFLYLYPNISEIITLALEEKYNSKEENVKVMK